MCLAFWELWQTFAYRPDGNCYGCSGLVTMFRRYVQKCGLNDFGRYDLKGKAPPDIPTPSPLRRMNSIGGSPGIHDSQDPWGMPGDRAIPAAFPSAGK